MPSFVETAIRRMSAQRRYNLKRRLENTESHGEVYMVGAVDVPTRRRWEANVERARRVLGRFHAIDATHAPKQ